MNNAGSVTLAQVKEALEDLGGEATWDKILKQLTENRNGDYSRYKDWLNYKGSAHQVIQMHCPGYSKYKQYGRTAHFEKTGNTFRLIPSPSKSDQGSPILTEKHTPLAIDIEENPSKPERMKQETYRILRDTALARSVKDSHQYQCQICKETFKLKDNTPYAEAHHIRPLGKPHNGPDVRSNILCVCPNDHVRLDYGAIELNETTLEGIGKDYIDYHNKKIYGKTLV